MQLQTAKITLGSTEYTIQAAGHRRARGWKKAFFAELYEPITENLTTLNNVDETPLTLADIPRYTPLAQELLIGTIDAVCALLIGYSPVLEAAREDIEETASDAQILDAFVEVLKLANPLPPGLFGGLNGLALSGILTSSPALNGISNPAKVTT